MPAGALEVSNGVLVGSQVSGFSQCWIAANTGY